MSSWGIDPTALDNKPKFLLDNEVTKYRREDSYATNQGWVMRAGSPATGNGNLNAAPEVLVAINGLAGTVRESGIGLQSGSTGFPGTIVMESGTNSGTDENDDLLLEGGSGLSYPTLTDGRFITTSHINGGSKTLTVELTYDEEVIVTGTPTIVIANGNQSTDGDGAHTLTYTDTGSVANRIRFTSASLTFSTNDVFTLGGANQADISQALGSISDTDGNDNIGLETESGPGTIQLELQTTGVVGAKEKNLTTEAMVSADLVATALAAVTVTVTAS